MKSELGYCKYCGQSRLMEVPDNYTQEMIDEDASKKCNCEDARAEAFIQDMINHTEYQLREVLKDHERIHEMSVKMVEPLARNTISKYAVSFGSYALKMIRKSDKISISLKYTEEEKRE